MKSEFLRIYNKYIDEYGNNTGSKIECEWFVQFMKLSGQNVPKLRDEFFDHAFQNSFSRTFLMCGKDKCFKKIRRYFVKDYILSMKSQ